MEFFVRKYLVKLFQSNFYMCARKTLHKDRMMNMITFWNPSTWFCNMTRHFCANLFMADKFFPPKAHTTNTGQVLPLFSKKLKCNDS